MEVISRKDLDFLLYDWLKIDSLTQEPYFADQDPADWKAFLDLAETLSVKEFLPTLKPSDRIEPALVDGQVITEPSLKAAVEKWFNAGMHLASVSGDHGGMGLPFTLACASMAELMAANVTGASFPMLTVANARVITSFGTPAQIRAFAAPQYEGRAFGTMCLSEPDTGSSLGDIITRALPDGEDDLGPRYRLRGNKMWISAGDQDISGDIIHLVLAKVPKSDGSLPGGSEGISLFLVPKYLPESHGGGRNDVTVQGLNHKMGNRGTPNCLMGFGEAEGALGWLLGREGQGLRIMFQMMNDARINVGLSGAALAYRGLILSTDYAAQRRQGRLQTDKSAPRPVVLNEHPDIRRMILAQRAIAEGALALCLKSALLADLADHAEDEATRTESAALLGLLTPVTKSWPSEEASTSLSHAIQIHGGYGYTRDFDVEQLWRDNRLNPIHEGTTGIQGIDLLGRKILNEGGGRLKSFLTRLRQDAQGTAFAPEAKALCQAADQIEGLVDRLLATGKTGEALGNATGFLQAFGHLVLGWVWLDLARSAQGTPLEQTKAATCRYFFAAEMPRIPAMLALLDQAPAFLANLDPALFQPEVS